MGGIRDCHKSRCCRRSYNVSWYQLGRLRLIEDMPLNSLPPTTTVENLMVKVNSAKGQCYVDIGFYGGVIPGNDQHLIPLHKAGVKGFKCFMIESGVISSCNRIMIQVDEFPCVDLDDITKALKVLKVSPPQAQF
jgi:allantoinase